MSKLRMRRGAIFDHSSSGACEMKLSYLSRTISHDSFEYGAIPDTEFNLTLRSFLVAGEELVASSRDFNPVHPDNL